MKKQTLLFLCLCITVIGYSQIQSGKVTYKIESKLSAEERYEAINSKSSDNVKQAILRKLKSSLMALRFVELELEFTPYESLFETTKSMQNDNTLDIKEAIRFTGTLGTYYSDLKKNHFYHQRPYAEHEFLIEMEFDDLDWEICDETKKIIGYMCIKATTTIISANGEMPVTSWFAPELPFPFGPKEFCGLPGLILAVDYDDYYFYAVTIDLDKKQRNIKNPTKGELVTDKRFFKIVEEYHNNIFKNR